jgi:hypothetical protein
LLYSKPTPLPVSLTDEEWSNSEASEAEFTTAVKLAVATATATETAETATIVHANATEDSDSQSYVVFHHLCVFFIDCHYWVCSVEGSNSGDADESLNVMLLSCQDPLLATTYKNLPEIP